MIFLCWGKKYYLIQNICAERVRDREREREISLSLSFSRKSFPIIKNCGFCLIMGRKLIRVTQINLRAAYSCLLKPGFPPIRSIRPHAHAPISPSEWHTFDVCRYKLGLLFIILISIKGFIK